MISQRNILKIILICLGISLLVYFSYRFIDTAIQKKKIETAIETIPSFSFVDLQGSLFSEKELKHDRVHIFVHFNSECDFCIHEAQSIRSKIDDFKDTFFLFISTETKEDIARFAKEQKLNGYKNIIFLHDENFVFLEKFGATTTPYLLIYDKNNKLRLRHKGQLKAEQLLKYSDNE